MDFGFQVLSITGMAGIGIIAPTNPMEMLKVSEGKGIDDVWTGDSTKWESLRNALMYGGAGSKILVTTRNESVDTMATVETGIHRLGQLSDNDIWAIMKRAALVGRSDAEDGRFHDIGRRVAEKCKELPLAAKALLEEYFCRVGECVGYLGSDKESSNDMELKGREFFDILAKHSLFQDLEKDTLDDRIINSFKYMILQNLFGRIAVRRPKAKRHAKSATGPLLVSRVREYGSIFLNLCPCLASTRLLRTKYRQQTIPQGIEKFMFHLRWLDLSNSYLSAEDVRTVCKLYNLQTLLEEIPFEISSLIHLRHLNLMGNDRYQGAVGEHITRTSIVDQTNRRRFEKQIELKEKYLNIWFYKCTNMQSLPPLGQLSLNGMDGLRIVNFSFQSLKKLKFYDCQKWEEWEDITAEEEESAAVSIMPRLTTLHIIKCTGLAKLPYRLLGKAASMEELNLYDSNISVYSQKSELAGNGRLVLRPTTNSCSFI
ncbi:hypothetical protein C2S53_014935 [Perilla frutescens var. hirtella]|uniref:NB-ARC domain-containing protein n=1 Tax=Perilla frutescens var. hirtella TaxID=608512 RepID=A0AAD4JBN7_PERFH|nr:hypothetical protein C2S53_014935 [Perilla frutescens var. hirtella]